MFGTGKSVPKDSSASMAVQVSSAVAATVIVPEVLGLAPSVIVTGLGVLAGGECVSLFCTGLGPPRGFVLYFSAAMRVLDGLLFRSTFLWRLGGDGGSVLVSYWL